MLKSPLEALVLLVHAIQFATSFRLKPAASGAQEGLLPDDFASKGSLEYKHEQSAMTFELKIVQIAKKAVIIAIAVENDKTCTLEFVLDDYFSPSAFPCIIPDSISEAEAALQHLFIHRARLLDLIKLYRTSILQKLLPGLHKEGYTEITDTQATPASTASGSGEQRPLGGTRDYLPDNGGPMGMYPRPNPLAPAPTAGYVPAPRAPMVGNPFDIGRSDLEPLGGLPMPGFPAGRLGAGNEGRGMILGPDHPLFRERFGNAPNSLFGDEDDFNRGGIGGLGEGMRRSPNNGGADGRRWGGDGYLPEMGAPPGARFDPVGPGQPIRRNRPGFGGSTLDPLGNGGGAPGFGPGSNPLGGGGRLGGFGGMGGGMGGGRMGGGGGGFGGGNMFS